jgi:hypothetical protein
MAQIRRFDHVGVTVADLDTVTAFFVGLGLEVEGQAFLEGEFATWRLKSTICRGPSTGWPRTATAWLAAGQYENMWRMAYVRGPEGILVSLAERIG